MPPYNTNLFLFAIILASFRITLLTSSDSILLAKLRSWVSFGILSLTEFDKMLELPFDTDESIECPLFLELMLIVEF